MPSFSMANEVMSGDCVLGYHSLCSSSSNREAVVIDKSIDGSKAREIANMVALIIVNNTIIVSESRGI